jgi:hypothetical protein
MTTNARETRQELAKDISRDLGRLTAELIKNLRAATPYRTGRAQQGWTATRGVGVDNYNTVITQNTVPYIGRLNEGSSKQAKAGFVQATIEAVTKGKNK